MRLTVDQCILLRLRMKVSCASNVNWKRQLMPVWGERPPIPTLGELEYVIRLGFLKTIPLMEIPAFAESRDSRHSVRSSRVRLVSFANRRCRCGVRGHRCLL